MKLSTHHNKRSFMTLLVRNPLIIAVALSIVIPLAACGKREAASHCSPFCSYSWNTSIDEIRAAEGEEYDESYASVYGGDTIVYPYEYKGISGSVKYIFDSNDRLVSTAFTCRAQDYDSLMAIYNPILMELCESFGEGEAPGNNQTAIGWIWRRPEGNIVLGAVTLEGQYALQIGYLSPEISTSGTEKS